MRDRDVGRGMYGMLSGPFDMQGDSTNILGEDYLFNGFCPMCFIFPYRFSACLVDYSKASFLTSILLPAFLLHERR